MKNNDLCVNKYVFLCYVLGQPKIGGEKNIISLLYTSYFKVLSMTDQKPVWFLL